MISITKNFFDEDGELIAEFSFREDGKIFLTKPNDPLNYISFIPEDKSEKDIDLMIQFLKKGIGFLENTKG